MYRGSYIEGCYKVHFKESVEGQQSKEKCRLQARLKLWYGSEVENMGITLNAYTTRPPRHNCFKPVIFIPTKGMLESN